MVLSRCLTLAEDKSRLSLELCEDSNPRQEWILSMMNRTV